MLMLGIWDDYEVFAFEIPGIAIVISFKNIKFEIHLIFASTQITTYKIAVIWQKRFIWKSWIVLL